MYMYIYIYIYTYVYIHTHAHTYTHTQQPVPLAHIGFCIAYASCREQLWRVLRTTLPDDVHERSKWTICTTGHSLGGALCTLFAAEVAVRFPDTGICDVMHSYV